MHFSSIDVPHDFPRGRRVLTRDEAVALAETALRVVSVPATSVTVSHRAAAIARIVDTASLNCLDLDELVLQFATRLGSNLYVTVGTNVRDAETLRQVIRHAESQKTPALRIEDQEPDDPSDPWVLWAKPKHYLPVTLWHDSTAQAMETARGETMAQMVTQMRTLRDAGQSQSSPLTMAGTVAVSAYARLCHHTGGMSAWGEATDSEVTVSVRTQDGKASGWSGQAHRDWNQIQPEQVVRDAVEMANRTRGAVRLEPGRYTTVLGPAAVGQLVRLMYYWFDVIANRGMTSPFGLVNSPDGKQLRLGQRVFDERISVWSDPNDPMGGYFPFFPDGWPSGKALWIEHGVLRNLAYDESEALRTGKLPLLKPSSMHIEGGTTTIDEMIARCDRGVYVHRFDNVEVADWDSGGLIGTTRDGCFLIKDGKIAHPVTNFRFFESPFMVFNRIMAAGVSERVAFGILRPRQISTITGDGIDDWPNPPIIVPPLMVRDFNFSSLSDAV